MKNILRFIKELFEEREPIRYKTMSRIGRMYIDRMSKTKKGRDELFKKNN